MYSSEKLYNNDFYAWTSATSQLLRQHKFSEIDIDALVEELDGMSARERRELMSRLDVLVMHLLKWQLQPGHRSHGWDGTIREQRRQISRLLKISPSLRRLLLETLVAIYSDAVERAAYETGIAEDLFPKTSPYTIEQILDKSFYPK